ncbi:MAG: hypothetical protein M3R61_19320, partial [Chloroflexota bacterium]|nr:hypothetical protein [Chloroflexota bacterium]
MSCLIEDRASQLRLTRPQVYVRTLGSFTVEVAGQRVACTVPGVGSPQMQRPLGYLIARCGMPVCKETLIGIAWRRSKNPPRYVIS